VRGSKREVAGREDARYKKEQVKLERQGKFCEMPRTEGCISAKNRKSKGMYKRNSSSCQSIFPKSEGTAKHTHEPAECDGIVLTAAHGGGTS
jgi:hypothetical protein